METSGNQRMAKSCRLFFGIFLTKKQRRHFQTGFYLIFEIEFRMEIISFWNMWPACHADCSIHSTPSSGLKHHVGNVRRSPDLNFQCQINSPQKMCRAFVSPSCFQSHNTSSSSPPIDVVEHFANLLCRCNPMSNGRTRCGVGRRLLFSSNQQPASQRAKIGVWIKRRATTFGEFEFCLYLLLPTCFKVLTFFFMQIYISL